MPSRNSQAPSRRAKPSKDPNAAYLQEVGKGRELKDRFMATQPESPFSEASLSFQGLKYFPIDPTWRVSARFRGSPGSEEVWLRTSQDGHASMRRLGELSFQRGGKSHALLLFHAGPQAGNVAFLPFRDLTSGKETYGPGRYLNLELQEGPSYELDFNQAFNPYCAYTSGYECPFPPVENDLRAAVRAGEKVYDPKNNPSSPQEAIRLLTVRFRERMASRKLTAEPTRAPKPSAGG
ncbi:MAG: DUF1684 domain-containing protein [Euryarchaeota archaeon]|nr:DUF1684 domain-containing protein [Euryarchaeota archaeon]